jgi:hypothetical protein
MRQFQENSMQTVVSPELARERLLNVARAVRESPVPNEFTMAEVVLDSGMPACAFAHYAWRTDLQDAFTPRKLPGGYTDIACTATGQRVPYFSELVLEHFAMNEEENVELFSAHGCGGARTPEQAAEYIEKFVARKYPQLGQPSIAGEAITA